jgi:hypothetical protein
MSRLINRRRSMSNGATHQIEEPPLDEAIDAGVRWLQERAAAWDVYERRAGAPCRDGRGYICRFNSRNEVWS